MSFDEARGAKQNYLASLNELEYDQRSGQVVMVAKVAKTVDEEYAKVRTKLLSILSGSSPRLHRCRTVNELNDRPMEIITQALEDLSADRI
jgi:hypothetical protein